MRSKLNLQVIITLIFVITGVYVGSHLNSNTVTAMNNPPDDVKSIFIAEDNETEIPQRPLLSIKKTINATVIEPYQWLHITVLITNIGNGTAYNLTIIDPALSTWAANSLNLTEERYVIVEYNASIYYDYYIQPVIEGNYTIEATNITYYDINGTQYRSYSQRFNVLCIKTEELPVLEKDKWLNMTYYLLAIFGILALIVIGDYIYIKLQERKTKTKKKKVQPKQPISKKKEKKRQKKQKKKRKK